MKRYFDLILVGILLLPLLMLMIIISMFVYLTSKGPVLYWSDRIGINSSIFKMPKFRSMKFDSPTLATHLMPNPEDFLTPIGGFLRRTSLDEIPQIFSILKGDMSFVGPRPALFNQSDLISLRVEKGVDKISPGLTGWAQVNGRDSLTINDKVLLEVEYLERKSFWFDLKILWLTALRVILRKGISH